MQNLTPGLRGLAAALVVAAGLSVAGPANAADHRPFVRKHPIITGVAAAAAIHHYRHRRHRAGHRSFVRKHPIITGVAAAAAVHHYRHRRR